MLLGGERSLAELLCFINNLALDFYCCLISESPGGTGNTSDLRSGARLPRDGQVGEPQDGLNVPILQQKPEAEGGIGVSPSPPGPGQPPVLLLWVLASTKAGAVGEQEGGLGPRVPLRPTGIAGDGRDAALPPDPLPCTPTLLCRGYCSLILH